jgi:hypothetical protein
MTRLDSDAFSGKTLVLVCIAGTLREAERAEEALASAGIDYCLGAEDFDQGILSSTRTGVGFYVVEGRASLARYELTEAQLQSGIIDADT